MWGFDVRDDGVTLLRVFMLKFNVVTSFMNVMISGIHTTAAGSYICMSMCFTFHK